MYIEADKEGIKSTGTNKEWRLVHDGVRVMALAEADGIWKTGGATKIFVAKSKAECEAEIAKLGLFVEPVEETKKVG